MTKKSDTTATDESEKTDPAGSAEAAAEAALVAVWAGLPSLILTAARNGQAIIVLDPLGIGVAATMAAPMDLDDALEVAALIDEEHGSDLVGMIRDRSRGVVPIVVNTRDTLAITMLSVAYVTEGGQA